MVEKTKKAFVISPIGSKGSDIRRHADMVYHSVLEQAFADSPYRLLRADQMSKPGMITNDIINEIVRSDVCIADMTGLNPNVFYELGIAHAAKRPTVHLVDRATALPFDNLGYRAIIFDPYDWHSQEEARASLRSVLGDIADSNFRVVNPVTSAQAEFELAKSADPQSETMETLLRRVDELEGKASKVASETSSEVPRFNRKLAMQIALAASEQRRIGAFLINIAKRADQDGLVTADDVYQAAIASTASKHDWDDNTLFDLKQMKIAPVAKIRAWFDAAIEIPF